MLCQSSLVDGENEGYFRNLISGPRNGTANRARPARTNAFLAFLKNRFAVKYIRLKIGDWVSLILGKSDLGERGRAASGFLNELA
jgi:hypothetical protein